MNLARMQDIGGCRAVLDNVAEVDALVKVYEEQHARYPKKDHPQIVKRKDYIAEPKADGYRSFHYVMEFYGRLPERKKYDGQKIEIQIRSKLQHAWATAVETCQAFTKQALKTRVKDDTPWLRFFALMSSAIAARESRPLVPNTPADNIKRRDEIRGLILQGNLLAQLEGWTIAMQRLDSKGAKGSVFVLELNTEQKTLQVASYRSRDRDVAYKKYFSREKATEDDPNTDVVLVLADCGSKASVSKLPCGHRRLHRRR